MLDMGFIRDVRKIVAACRSKRQTLLFSATMPPDIAKLADDVLHQPERIDVSPQDRHRRAHRAARLLRRRQGQADAARPSCSPIPRLTACSSSPAPSTAPTGCAEQLKQAGIRGDAIHGNKSQNARERALDGFRAARCACWSRPTSPRAASTSTTSRTSSTTTCRTSRRATCTASAARRAPAPDGAALSFCDQSERPYLRAIEQLDAAQGDRGRASSRRDAVRGRAGDPGARGAAKVDGRRTVPPARSS